MATDYYMTADAGAGGVGSQADPWDETEFIQWVNGSAAPNPPVVVAGDRCYVESGTYTIGTALNTGTDGTSGNLIEIIGVTDIDNPTTTEATVSGRPRFNMGANLDVVLDDLWWVRNLNIVGSKATPIFRIDVNSRAENVRVENQGAGGAFTSSGHSTRFVNCEGIAPSSTAFSTFSTFPAFINCIARDSAAGIAAAGEVSLLSGCLIYNITNVGAALAGVNRQSAIGNTFYNCGTAITGTGVGVSCIFLQNIIDSCTASAVWTAAQGTDLWDWNNFFNSGAPSNVTVGPNTLAVDPKFVNAAGGDFRVQEASLLNRGLVGAAIGARQFRPAGRLWNGGIA